MLLWKKCDIYVSRENKKDYCVFTEHYDYEAVVNTTGYKTKNVPYKCFKVSTPKWVSDTLQRGEVVDINSVEICSNPNGRVYAVMRGKIAVPEVEVCSNEYWSERSSAEHPHMYKFVCVERTYHKYEGLKLLFSFNETVLKQFSDTAEEWAKFKEENPLPRLETENVVLKRENKSKFTIFCRDGEFHVFEDTWERVRSYNNYTRYNYDVKPDYENMKVNYSIEKSVEDGSSWATSDDKNFTSKELAIKSMTLIREFISKEDGPKYESNDGRGWRQDIITYNNYEYDIELEDGRVVRHIHQKAKS